MTLLTVLFLVLLVLIRLVSRRTCPRAGRRLVLLVATCLGLFVALELSVRGYLGLCHGSWGARPSMHDLSLHRGHELHPGFVHSDGSVEHNAQGFRRRTPVALDKGTALRVFVCGGSGAYGTGSSYGWYQPEYTNIRNEDTVDAWLERDLTRRMGRPVEVINAAVAEYRVHHHLIYLLETLLSYRPDAVVFLDGFNDLGVTSAISRFHRRNSSVQPYYDMVNRPTLGHLAGYLILWLKDQSAFLRTAGAYLRLFAIHRGMERALARPRPATPATTAHRTEVVEKAGRDYLQYARLIVSICRDRGVIPVFALQPILLADTTKPLVAIERKYKDFQLATGEDPEVFGAQLEAFRDRLSAFCDAGGVPFADLTQPFAGVTDQAYSDYCHLTPRGYQVLADRLAPILQAALARPRRARAQGPSDDK